MRITKAFTYQHAGHQVNISYCVAQVGDEIECSFLITAQDGTVYVQPEPWRTAGQTLEQAAEMVAQDAKDAFAELCFRAAYDDL
jgi:hypothetical protein